MSMFCPKCEQDRLTSRIPESDEPSQIRCTRCEVVWEQKTDATIYERKGFRNRVSYLKSIAEDFDMPVASVIAVAKVLGPLEDFDALIVHLEDYSY